ncbi:MAG TPA: MurR/RpiR family transcriptional regulator [Firmicutes bacterium]|nr:MurR/RpiR family transcriptional regulator [Bacillota bacterium]
MGPAQNFASSGCQVRLERAYDGLSLAERRAADYILEHPSKVIHMSVTEFAEKVGVSEATIVRLCQKVGFKGYHDLRLRLAGEVTVPRRNMYETITGADNIQTVMEKAFALYTQSLKDTLSILDVREMERAVDSILKAGKVQLYGAGGSGGIASVAYEKLLRVGVFSSVCTDPHTQAVLANMLGPGDVAIGISHSGASLETVNVIHLAKETGATTIGITNQSQSPLAKLVDIKLITGAQETPLGPEAGVSRIAQVAVVDVLCLGIALKKDLYGHP